MYQLGRQSKHRRRWPIWLAVCIVLLLLSLVAVWVYRQLSNSGTTLNQADAVTTTVAAVDERRKVFDTPDFTVELPFDWKQLPKTPGMYNLYRFQGVDGGAAQTIEVYVDTMPAKYAVNRVVAVEANGTQIGVNGTVSDNCKDFTKANASSAYGGTLAKWRSIDFLCDLNNVSRNVVGTSSPGAINSLELTSLSGAKRKVFLTYADQTIDYNFDSFFNALTTFRLK